MKEESEALRREYRAALARTHPDRNGGRAEAYHDVQRAYAPLLQRKAANADASRIFTPVTMTRAEWARGCAAKRVKLVADEPCFAAAHARDPDACGLCRGFGRVAVHHDVCVALPPRIELGKPHWVRDDTYLVVSLLL